jgi:hypothetical protein
LGSLLAYLRPGVRDLPQFVRILRSCNSPQAVKKAVKCTPASRLLDEGVTAVATNSSQALFLIEKFDAVLFDDGVSEDVAGDGVDVFVGLLAGSGGVERDLEILALPHRGDVAITEAIECVADGLTLRIEDGGFRRNVDSGFHEVCIIAGR